jgi:hypothetical protein
VRRPHFRRSRVAHGAATALASRCCGSACANMERCTRRPAEVVRHGAGRKQRHTRRERCHAAVTMTGRAPLRASTRCLMRGIVPDAAWRAASHAAPPPALASALRRRRRGPQRARRACALGAAAGARAMASAAGGSAAARDSTPSPPTRRVRAVQRVISAHQESAARRCVRARARGAASGNARVCVCSRTQRSNETRLTERCGVALGAVPLLRFLRVSLSAQFYAAGAQPPLRRPGSARVAARPRRRPFRCRCCCRAPSAPSARSATATTATTTAAAATPAAAAAAALSREASWRRRAPFLLLAAPQAAVAESSDAWRRRRRRARGCRGSGRVR